MPTAARRLTSVPKRTSVSAGNIASAADDNRQYTSDAASGLSDDVVIDPHVFGSVDGESADREIDPEAPYGRKADGTPRKRRGRQAGAASAEKSARSAKKTKGALGIEGLASIMSNMTLMLAAATNIPEASLSNDETTLISNAAENVAQFYDFSLDSKAVAWANLAMVTGGIIGAHVIAYKIRRDTERQRAA